MKGKKAANNRTIDTGLREGREYLDRCLTVKDLKKSGDEASGDITDRIIAGDCLKVMGYLPAGTVVGQSVEAFTEIEEHSKIILRVSTGPEA